MRAGKRLPASITATRTGATVFPRRHAPSAWTAGDAGGRVLGVTASGSDLGSAIAKAYEAIGHVEFEGMHFRRDIGKRGVAQALLK